MTGEIMQGSHLVLLRVQGPQSPRQNRHPLPFVRRLIKNRPSSVPSASRSRSAKRGHSVFEEGKSLGSRCLLLPLGRLPSLP